jgi:hypothetical protein
MGKSKFNKVCVLDFQKYSFCGSCSSFAKYPRWMESFCSDNCHIIFNTIMEYKAGVKTPAECAEILKGCDLSKRDSFDQVINNYITAILAEGVNEKSFDEKSVEDKPVNEKSVDEKPVDEKPVDEKLDVEELDKKENSHKNEGTSKYEKHRYNKKNYGY